ncbi:hypothetical protein EPO34_00775 [Patescibacteria group bacterium]|nr:MAG: hypothetical protein EPO34_00775 [Patescibacteria group bacterium]
MTFATIDKRVIGIALRFRDSAGFLALGIVYAWFGILKVLGISPTSPLVLALLDKTMPGISPDTFMLAFGAFETVIGLLFLFPVAVRLVVALMAAHMAMTVLPLALLPGMTWTGPFVPTLEGQYILKNLVLLALALTMVAATPPLAEGKSRT